MYDNTIIQQCENGEGKTMNAQKAMQMQFFRVETKHQKIILDWFKADHDLYYCK